jgi:hypothetical protein
MGTQVWVQANTGALVRADQIVRIETDEVSRVLRVRLAASAGTGGDVSPVAYAVRQLARGEHTGHAARQLATAIAKRLAEGAPGVLVLDTEAVKFEAFDLDGD